jgi:hypothetical protein
MHCNVSYIVNAFNLVHALQQRAGGKKAEHIREMRELLGPVVVNVHGDTSIRMRPDQFALAAYLMDSIGAKFTSTKRIDNSHVALIPNKVKHDITERGILAWKSQCMFVHEFAAFTLEQKETIVNVINDIEKLDKAMVNMEGLPSVQIQGVTFKTVNMLPMFAARREAAQDFLLHACDLIFRKDKKEEFVKLSDAY